MIADLASVLGLVGSAPIKQASCCATKGAVVNLTRGLAVQWAREGVRVKRAGARLVPDGYMMCNCPMARAGEVHELDSALLFLASDASSCMTGQILTIDGGWIAR